MSHGVDFNHCPSLIWPRRENETDSWNDLCEVDKDQQGLALTVAADVILSQEAHPLTSGHCTESISGASLLGDFTWQSVKQGR